MNDLITNNLNLLLNTANTAINITSFYLKYKHNKEQVEYQNNLAYYPERLKIYHSIQGILCKLISSPNNAEILWLPFLQKTRDVPFLFGKDIQDKCKEIYIDIIDLDANNQLLESTYQKLELANYISSNITDEEHEELKIQYTCLIKEKNVLIKKINHHNIDLENFFQPYISIVKDQINPKISYHPYPSVLSIPPTSQSYLKNDKIRIPSQPY